MYLLIIIILALKILKLCSVTTYGREQKRLTLRIRNYDRNYDCNEYFTRKLQFVITKT